MKSGRLQERLQEWSKVKVKGGTPLVGKPADYKDDLVE